MASRAAPRSAVSGAAAANSAQVATNCLLPNRPPDYSTGSRYTEAGMRVSTVAERIEAVRLQIADACLRSGRSPEEVTIVAVTKGFPPEAVR